MNQTKDDCTIFTAGARRATARRRKVIDVARKLFADNGFHATGIAQIARESGVAVGQIYRDFASKEDIVAEIVGIDCSAFLDDSALKDALSRRDLAGVRAWIVRIVEPDEDDDDRLFVEILAESSRNARIADIFQTMNTKVRRNMHAALATLAPDARCTRRLDVLSDTILTMSLGLLHHRVLRPDAPVTDLVVALKRLIERELDDLQRDAGSTAP